jgi:hypothetical protein
MYPPHLLLLRAYVYARKYAGANAANHRPEQSALSLLFWKINVGRRAGPTATEKLVLFSKMDKDRSGGLNAEELQINSRLDGKHLNETELNNLFHAFDSNQDGFLDFQELDRNGNGMQGALSERGLDRHMFYETSRIYWVSNSVRQPRVQSCRPIPAASLHLSCMASPCHLRTLSFPPKERNKQPTETLI